MSASLQPRMAADEFICWALDQPKGARHEWVAGLVVAMACERVAHVRSKQSVFRLLAEAIAASGLRCEAFVDGLAVQVDETTVYEPDALVRCGPPLADDALRVVDPLVLVEVRSPSSQSRDSRLRLVDYFRIPSLRHYLIAATDIRAAIHHATAPASSGPASYGTVLSSLIRRASGSTGFSRMDTDGSRRTGASLSWGHVRNTRLPRQRTTRRARHRRAARRHPVLPAAPAGARAADPPGSARRRAARPAFKS